MAELFKLERGNPDNLEGRAVVYGQVTPPHCSLCRYTGLYVGTNPSDVIDEDLRKPLEIALRKADVPAEMLSSKPVKSGMCISSRIIKCRELSDVLAFKGDLINLGEFNSEGPAWLAYEGASMAYMAKYHSQWTGRMNLGKSAESHAGNIEQLDGQDLLKGLYMTSGKLIEAYDKNDSREVSRLKRTLAAFAVGNNLLREVEILEGFTSNKEDPHRFLRVQRQAELIDAVHREKYEEAASLRDQIKALG